MKRRLVDAHVTGCVELLRRGIEPELVRSERDGDGGRLVLPLRKRGARSDAARRDQGDGDCGVFQWPEGASVALPAAGVVVFESSASAPAGR